MRPISFAVLTCLIFGSAGAIAQESTKKPDALKKERCVAPEISLKADESVYPGDTVIQNTSNLRRKTGLALIAAGDRISFSGKIVDSDCVPVPDARIEIWQADMVGAYGFPIKKRKPSTDPSFVGSGRVQTDNEGNFTFLTIFPGSYEKRAPHINYRITHPDFKESIGAVFFEYHPANEKDPVLQQYRKEGQRPLIAEKMTPGSEERMTDRDYYVKIILKGRSAFRRF